MHTSLTFFVRKALAVKLLCVALALTAAQPVVADWLGHEDASTGVDLRVWASDGGEKITREKTRSFDTSGVESTLNEVWDGSSVATFGARNEIVSFAVMVDNNGGAIDDLAVEFDELANSAQNYSLATTRHSLNRLFDWRDRPIEVFVVEYLRIHGLSRISYAFDDETHIPEMLRRPIPVNIQPIAPAVGEGVWADRPQHDQSYPDIAIPQEVQIARGGLTVNSGESQIFWVDVYIPKDAPAGLLTGTLGVLVDGNNVIDVPVEIEVLDFALPDERHSKTMVYIEARDVKERYFTGPLGALPFDQEQDFRDVMNRHYSLAWRHGISLFDANELLPDQAPDVNQPNVDWQTRLNGGLYTPGNGYAGPGQGMKHDIYVVGSYGAWSFWWDLREYHPNSTTFDPQAPLDELEATLIEKTSLWENWFQDNAPDVTRFLYVEDEPGEVATLAYSELISGIVEGSPLAGSELGTFVTANLVHSSADLPSPSILSSIISVGDTDAWDAAILNQPDRQLYMYNGQRPASGTFATDDDGVALRELAWGQYKRDIERWFYWHSTYYNNTQGGPSFRNLSQIAGGEGETYRLGSQTNVFKSAHTFGGHVNFDAVRGESGFNYGNGDGLLFYPGTDVVFPAESRGMNGPIASLRLKHWRRGIQDVQYLALAAQIDPGATQAIVNQMVPSILWEPGVADPQDPTYVNKAPSWSNDPDDWEQARRSLATIIESAVAGVAPTISEHPEGQELVEGDALLLSAVAEGTPAPTFQWQKDGADIPLATASSFTITEVGLDDAGSYAFVVSNTHGDVISDVATVTVTQALTAPEFVTQPQSAEAVVGESVSFTPEISGNPAPELQWFKDGVAIAGATAASLAIAEVVLADAGDYQLQAANSEGAVASEVASLTVTPAAAAPEIVAQPLDVAALEGASATFSVEATGEPEPAYQWQKDGVAIGAATSAEFTIAAVVSDDAGSYNVIVSNSEGSVTSAAALLEVSPELSAPVFVTQPQASDAIEGASVSFSAEVSGNPEPDLQWFKDGAAIPNATADSLAFAEVALEDAGSYELRATNSEGSVASDAVSLSVTAAFAAPEIVTQPLSTAIFEGESATFSVAATGVPEPEYQWQKDGVAISDANAQAFEIASGTNADAGSYSVVVSNSEGSVISDVATLEVSPTPFAPEFLAQPTDQSVIEGDDVVFSAAAAGLPQPTYQWFVDDVAIDGETDVELSLTAVSLEQAGSYTIVATNTEGFVVSQSAVLSVAVATSAPVFELQPVDQSAAEGDDVVLSATATGQPQPTYQWLKDGSEISAATTADLSLVAVTPADSGSYTLVATNSEGSVTSTAAVLEVSLAPFAPQFVSQPTGRSAIEGEDVVLSADASGLPQPSYQWFLNNVLIAGAAAAELTLGSVSSADAGSYTVVASNSEGAATSDPAIVDVSPALFAPQFDSQPASQSAIEGDTVVLSVTATGLPEPTYQWFADGVEIDGATASDLSLTAVTLAASGSYTVVASNSEGSVTSTPAVLTVSQSLTAPVFVSQPNSQIVSQGEGVTFTVDATGLPEPTYQWFVDGVALAGETSAVFSIASVTSADAGGYTVSASNSEGSIVSNAAELSVTVSNQNAPTTANVALIVGNPSRLTSGDAGLQVALEAQGHTVTLFDDGAADVSNTGGSNLVLISGSASVARLSDRFVADTRPVMVGEYLMFGTMQLTGTISNVDFGRLPTNNTLTLVSAASSIGATAGDVQVLTRNRRMVWGRPGASGVTLATADGDPTRATLFSYEAGVQLPSGSPAAGKRMGIYLSGFLANLWTDDGLSLFEQSVDWMLSDGEPVVNEPILESPTVVADPDSIVAEEGEQVSFSATVTGSPEPSYQWLKDGVAVAGATATELVLVANENTVGSYSLQASNSEGSVLTQSASLSLAVDDIAPEVVSVSSSSLTQLQIQFSEPVTTQSAEAVLNYSLQSGAQVLVAELAGDSTVNLTTSELQPSSSDTLLVQSVTDLSGNPLATVSESFATISDSVGVALIVGNPSRLTSGDVGLQSALVAQGHTVTLHDDGAADTSSTAGNNLIVISGSASAARLGNRFVADTRPVMVGEYLMFGPMELTGNALNVDYGRLSSNDTLTVLPAATTIGASAGDVQVLTRNRRMVWGRPGASSVTLAVADGDPSRATLFSYEAGTQLPSGSTAAGKRMGIYLSGFLANLWTEEGRTLFDQSVAWLLSN